MARCNRCGTWRPGFLLSDGGLCEVCVPPPILTSRHERGAGVQQEPPDGRTPEAGPAFTLELERIPGVGSVTALRLFDAGFRAWERLVDADPEELTEVNGVGPDTARRILSFVAAQERADRP